MSRLVRMCLAQPGSVAKPARQIGHAMLVFLCLFCVYRPYKESISKKMNNDDLNLHSMTKLSGWLCHWPGLWLRAVTSGLLPSKYMSTEFYFSTTFTY